MTKVKIIYSNTIWGLENTVNDFIAKHNMKDIKFQTNGENQARTVFTVMIIYEE